MASIWDATPWDTLEKDWPLLLLLPYPHHQTRVQVLQTNYPFASYYRRGHSEKSSALFLEIYSAQVYLSAR